MLLSETVGVSVDLPANAKVGIGYSREFLSTYTVASCTTSPTRTMLRLQEIQSAEAVADLVERAVYIQTKSVTQRETDRYSVADIEGCAVFDDKGLALGVITDVMLLPANDVWVVTTHAGKTIPLPVIDDVIVHVDVSAKIIRVSLLPGLEDLDSTDERETDEREAHNE